jgi:tRNA threonylcarbamoyl adenosine modification protein YeaZ
VILALETSSATASAAVVDAGGVPLGESRPAAGSHQARRLLECVHEALTVAGVALDDVATVVCGLGPGTFTGLRIGVATARALAQAAGLQVAGVPSLEALARGLAATAAGAHADCLVPLIDGRRDEVFAAVYKRVPPEPERVAEPGRAPAEPSPWPDLELVVQLTVVGAGALTGFLESRPGAVVGGDGALLHADRLPPAVVCERAVAGPSALMVARTFLAGSPALTVGFAATLPIYGREPDAVPRSPATIVGVASSSTAIADLASLPTPDGSR